jgi:hypothetical protein
MRRTKTPKIVATTELCGEPYDPEDPSSPRCVRVKPLHGALPHQALGPRGETLEWTTPKHGAPARPLKKP